MGRKIRQLVLITLDQEYHLEESLTLGTKTPQFMRDSISLKVKKKKVLTVQPTLHSNAMQAYEQLHQQTLCPLNWVPPHLNKTYSTKNKSEH